MPLQTLISTLQTQEIKSYLNLHAIKHLWIAGSFARGNETAESDIDILVNVDEAILTTDYYSLLRYLQGKLGRSIELIDKDYINPHVKSSLLSDTIAVW